MTWAETLAVAAVLVSAGIFVDKYHAKSAGSKWTQGILIRAFVVLDDVKPMQLSGRLLHVHILVPILGVVLSTLVVMALGWYFRLMLVFVPIGLPSKAIEPLALLVGGVQLAVFLGLRKLASLGSDVIATLALLSFPTLFVVLALSTMTEPWHLIAYFIVVVAALPMFLLVLAGAAVLALKYLTLVIRWTAMHFIDGATNPKTDPFAYFGAPGGVLTVAAKAVSELW